MINILLVDDDQISIFLASKVLESIPGVKNVCVASNGLQAINVLTDGPATSFAPDIIFLDLNMPIMDGFDFLKAFARLEKNEQRPVKVIVVSSSVNMADIIQAKALGATDYVSKPLTIEQLQHILGALREAC